MIFTIAEPIEGKFTNSVPGETLQTVGYPQGYGTAALSHQGQPADNLSTERQPDVAEPNRQVGHPRTIAQKRATVPREGR